MFLLDSTFHYLGHNGQDAFCRLRLYTNPPSDGAVVLLTELPANRNTSITNLIEQVCADVLREYHHLLPGLTGGKPPIFIEHYPHNPAISRDRREFSRVEFSSYTPYLSFRWPVNRWRLPSPPHWSPLTAEEVSALIGEAAPVELVSEYPQPEAEPVTA